MAAADVRAPFDVGSNEFGVRKIDSDTTHKACELPAAWSGSYVDLYCSGGTVHFGFSTSASAEVDLAVAATDAGASAKVGGVLLDGLGNRVPKCLPVIRPDQKLYLIHESTADNTVLYIELSSAPKL
jgi:hypothetical protein